MKLEFFAFHNIENGKKKNKKKSERISYFKKVVLGFYLFIFFIDDVGSYLFIFLTEWDSFFWKIIRYSRSIINACSLLSHEWWVPP